MKIKMFASLCGAQGEITDTVRIRKSELDGMDECEKDTYIMENYVDPWITDHLNISYEEE